MIIIIIILLLFINYIHGWANLKIWAPCVVAFSSVLGFMNLKVSDRKNNSLFFFSSDGYGGIVKCNPKFTIRALRGSLLNSDRTPPKYQSLASCGAHN